MLKHFILTVLSLSAWIHSGSSENGGCPEADEVLPCTCKTVPLTYLECKGISNPEDLRRVFRNSENYKYKEVHIESSTLQYLPHEIFDKVKVLELYFKDVTLNQLFDETPEALDDLWKLHLENTVLRRGVVWKLLEPIKSLSYLSIYHNEVKKLGKDFNQYTPKSLENLILYETKTKALIKGVFHNFTNLNRVEIVHSKLANLNRNIFDETFNGRYLYFNNNSISKISADMFHKMPNIKTIILNNNQLSGLSKDAFDGNFGNLDLLFLEGNPVKCDCYLQWLARDKPRDITGKCVSPKPLRGRELKDLKLEDFNCKN